MTLYRSSCFSKLPLWNDSHTMPDWINQPKKRLDGKFSISPPLADRGFGLVEGVVGRAHQRPGFNVFEAHRFAQYFVFGEFAGMRVANDGQMFASRLQILPERKDIRALRHQILHSRKDFVLFFAEAEHQPRLGRNFRMRFFGATQQLERALIYRAFADL